MADYVLARKSRNIASSAVHVLLNILLGMGAVLITVFSENGSASYSYVNNGNGNVYLVVGETWYWVKNASDPPVSFDAAEELDAEEPLPDPTIRFSDFSVMLREKNMKYLILEETIQGIESLDYEQMQESMIYGESLPFDELMENIRQLNVRIKSLPQ